MTLEILLHSLPHLATLCGLIVLSGLISSSETALFTLTRQQLARFRQSPKRADQLVIRLHDDPTSLLSTILLANIAVNILLYAMLAVFVSRLAGGSSFWIVVFGTTGFLIVLLGAEIAPKLLAFALGEWMAPVVARPIRILEIATFPIRWCFSFFLVEPLTRILVGGTSEEPDIVAEDLQKFIDISQTDGLIDVRETAILHELMELSDLRVCDLMVPRVDVVAFDLDDDAEDLVRLFESTRLLRIPVYEGDIDNVKGIIFAREFLLNRDGPTQYNPISNLVRPVRFIPEQAGVEDLLRHFRATGTKLALVVDEYGGLAGVIALEDIVEAIVGQLHSHYDDASVPSVQRINQTTYLVDAALEADDFCQAFNLPIEETRIHTVGGLVNAKLDRLPEDGDQTEIGDARLEVIRMIGRRIRQVRLILADPIPDSPQLSRLMRMTLPESRREATVRKGETP